MNLVMAGAFLFALFSFEQSFGQTSANNLIVAINCGGPEHTAADGTLFTGDQYNVSGGTFTQGNADDIVGTVDDLLYKSERNGNFGYAIPVPAAGDYKVTLLFAEVWFGSAGSRVFNVSIEGQELLSNFDIVAEVGKNVALKKEFELEITDGVINIAATTVISDGAKISGIIVEKAVAPNNAPPVTLIGSWTAGEVKAKEIGKNRMLVVVTGTEHGSEISTTSITYGGQLMTKVTESVAGTGYREYSSIFILKDSGITAATNDSIQVTWSASLNEGFSISSAFYENVDQSVDPADTSSTTDNSSLIAPAMNVGNGYLYLLGSALANSYTSIDNGFTEELIQLKNSTVDGIQLKWGHTVIHSKTGTGASETATLTIGSGRGALSAIILKNALADNAPPVTLLDSWTAGTTKPKAAGTKRLLVVTVTGETAVMNDITDLSLTYGGQAMNKIVSTSEGTTGFGNMSYIFTLNEAGIAAADETGTITPTWTTLAPTGGVDIFSAFYTNVDQTTPVSATSFVHLNGTLVTAPAVATVVGDMVLMSVAFAGQPRTPTYTTGFTEILKNPNSQSWGSGIIAFKEADGTEVIPSITNTNGERAALTAIVIKKGKNLIKTPPVLLDTWTAGTTKPKAAGTKRVLVVAVTGETAVMNDITDLSLTYGGQAMNKIVSTSEGTTGFGNISYIFTLNETGIAAADETGTIAPTWTTIAPTGGVDFFSAFYGKVDQDTPVSDTSFVHLNGTLVTAPAVAADAGDLVLMSVAFAGQPRTPTYTTGFVEVLKNPNAQSWGSGIIAFKEADGKEVIPSITNSNGERAALTAIVLKGGEEEGVAPTYYKLTTIASAGGTIKIDPVKAKFLEGSVVKFKAVPDFGYYFVNWTDDLNGIVTDTASIVMNSNKTISANFAEKTKYTITTEVSNGNIFLSPSGGTYYEGVEVTVLVKTNVGFEFKGWGGDISGTENPQKIVVNSNKTVSANIEKIPAYTLSITATNGSVKVSPMKETYEPGSAAILIATPAEGYKFSGWEGDLTGIQNPTSLVMGSDKNVKAIFKLITSSNTLNDDSKALLEQNYPNPFSTITTIPYNLNEASNVKLTVFNFLGEKVKILVNEHRSAGHHEVVWDASDFSGKQMSKGIYFIKMEIGNNPAEMKKSILIR